ncbi:GTP-binding protein EngB required for normal cell division [Paenibacillus amylolyticus]|uniref:GTP-binding protein EngB required for normal cell division n=1 Tax=Paenibacillus amylolyticus TaxID=1451 RepID=A0AAP5H4F9_PAEAM|nr:dynamin family protein [Paenibacillus amylolyticus]MDR6726180.1 GTP-binding protein EngB required for normal cell division [Paenibacillus amylolyticus]
MGMDHPDIFETQLLHLIHEFQSLNLTGTAAEEYYRNRADHLARQLEEREFRITVVGDFSAGKSTFLNALIGQDILPHARTETTATVTYIRNIPANHPDVDTIKVHFKDHSKPTVVFNLREDPAALKRYTTTQSEVRVVQEISHVDVYVNFMKTDERVVFIDTPGLNGVADGHRDLTMHEIKQAHASICLFHLRSLAYSNLEFLKLLQKHQRTFLFILNFIDEIKTSEGDSVERSMDAFRSQLQMNLDMEASRMNFRVFGVSALKALAAKDTSIPRLYDGDLVDLSLSDRENLFKESRFPEFEDNLWGNVLHGERNRAYQSALYLAFETLLAELQAELHSAIHFSQVQLDEGEMFELERRLKQLEEVAGRNWTKVEHYMGSRQADLEKLVKAKITEDLADMLVQISNNIQKDDFETFELAIHTNEYSKLLQNKTSELSMQYEQYLSTILEEIYQTTIMRVKEYSPSIELEAQGTLAIQMVSFDGTDYRFEKQIVSLQDKQIQYAVQKKELLDEQEHFARELDEVNVRMKKVQQNISQTDANQMKEQNKLGHEPTVMQWKETRYKTKPRATFSLFRIFGSDTYEEAYEATVTDSSDRDEWRQEKERMQTKYAQIKEKLQKESMELTLRKRQFETKAAQYTDRIEALQTRLDQVEKDIRSKQIEYEEIMMKAKQEFLRTEKRRLLERIERFLDEHVAPDLKNSVNRNVEDNMIVIREDVRIFYHKNQAEVKNRLSRMLETGKEKLQEQLLPYERLTASVKSLETALYHIKPTYLQGKEEANGYSLDERTI